MSTDPASFAAVQIESIDDGASIRAAARSYETAILSVLRLMLDRYALDRCDGLLDMKFDLLTGDDFPASDPICGPRAVFSWIQGRGLEALAGHAAWLCAKAIEVRDIHGRGDLAGTSVIQVRIHDVTSKLIDRTERLRRAAGGRLRFLMTLDGRAMSVNDEGALRAIANDADGPSNYSDLFYAKGLAAAAAMVGDAARGAEARTMFDRIVADIESNRFVSDQEQLDARNPVRHVGGQVPHGPRMIGIGAATVFFQITGERTYLDTGIRFIEHIIDYYSNAAGEMWEVNDSAGRPLIANGVQRNDPGHATEFAGLSLKLLRVGEVTRADLRHRLVRVLKTNFALGFATSGIGIVKAVDLATRTPMNTDMPWWSLPETMRAAMEALHASPEDRQLPDIARRCSNAFMRYYVRPDRWLCANQTLDATGAPAARIPATPDIDPGYHTGLSLIDCLDLFAAHWPRIIR